MALIRSLTPDSDLKVTVTNVALGARLEAALGLVSLEDQRIGSVKDRTVDLDCLGEGLDNAIGCVGA
jgi:hypothetical protein